MLLVCSNISMLQHTPPPLINSGDEVLLFQENFRVEVILVRWDADKNE